MKKINFVVTKCTNPKCGFSIIADPVKKDCPICGKKMVKDNRFKVQGFDDEKNDDGFIGFKKNKGYNGNHNRFKKTKNKKS